MKTFEEIRKLYPEEIDTFINDLESCTLEQIQSWWKMKFAIRKRQCLERIVMCNIDMNLYPKCKSVLVLE